MATTVKELGDKLDEMSERFASKLDSGSKELTEKIDSSARDLTTKIDKTAGDLVETKTELASVLATLSAAKWIGTTAVIATTLLGSAGIWKIVADQKHLQETAARNDKLVAENERLTKERARLVKSDLIDRIEREIVSAGSLDALKDKPKRWHDQLRKMASGLRENNDNLDSVDKTDYYRIVQAIDYYLDEKYQQCINVLTQIRAEDQEYFGYLDLRGSCAARLNARDADEWFRRAAAYSSDRAQMVDLQRAYVAMSRWVLTKDQAELDRAIKIYSNLADVYPRYSPAFLNLAGAYSQGRRFSDVTATLKRLRVFASKEYVIEYITKDMTEEKDFENYVRGHLGVTAEPRDDSWGTELKEKLESDLRD